MQALIPGWRQDGPAMANENGVLGRSSSDRRVWVGLSTCRQGSSECREEGSSEAVG